MDDFLLYFGDHGALELGAEGPRGYGPEKTQALGNGDLQTERRDPRDPRDCNDT